MFRLDNQAIVDPLSDLNAMHEVEKALTREELISHNRWLTVASGKPRPHDEWIVEHYVWHSTAAQRAEALLRTLGKWDDAK